MTDSTSIQRLRAGIHTSLAKSAPELKYVLRSLLRLAGYGVEFVWADAKQEAGPLDVYYGPHDEAVNPSAAGNVGGGAQPAVEIRSCGLPFSEAPRLEPLAWSEKDGLAFLDFGAGGDCHRPGPGRLRFTNDIVFSAYWLLTGAREPGYRRDRLDNLHLDGSFFLQHGLCSRPLVSEYGAMLRHHFAQQGRPAAPLPWSSRGAAFAFTHDVDYPQIIRSIESLRLLASRGLKALPSIAGVLRGSNHFWKFAEWVEFERALGTRPTFYFLGRKGSLAEYAMGTPDGFYDIRSKPFTALFRQLREQGCEIGLHASYHAHRSAGKLRSEKETLEQAAGVKVEGNRHHYWHLDPAAPDETLRRQEQAGLIYDSSLAFEFYPGFRRGICHPFRPYHPGERRELDLLELPPAWMDDHFGRRLEVNGIADPAACAKGLVTTVRALGGVVVVDYHARGMNSDFYPQYGAWLMDFVRSQIDSTMNYQTAGEIVRQYRKYEETLTAASLDRTVQSAAAAAQPAQKTDFEVGRMRPEEVGAVAQLHFDFFGVGEMHGTSLANLGVDFLEKVFYGLNLDNPYLFVDVARYRGEVIGFSVYSSDWRRVSREPLRRHFGSLVLRSARFALREPLRFATHVIDNLRFMTDKFPESVNQIRAWYFLLGVRPAFRTREFRRQTGISLSGSLWDQMVRTLREQGCDSMWGAAGAHNRPINRLFVENGSELLGQSRIQGVVCNLYKMRLVPAGSQQQ